MEISPARIILMILWSMAFGGFCGVCNDVNRFVRALLCWENSSKLSCIKKIDAVKKYTFLAIAIVQDIFLFLLLGAGVSVLNYYFNNGELRIYTVISVSVGFFVYYLTLGRLVRWCLNGIAGGVKAVIFAIFRLVWTPFAIICSFFDKMDEFKC